MLNRSDDMALCLQCQRKATKLCQCGIAYCSSLCQAAAWSKHKRVCVGGKLVPTEMQDFWSTWKFASIKGEGGFGTVIVIQRNEKKRALKLYGPRLPSEQILNTVEIVRNLRQHCPSLLKYYGIYKIPIDSELAKNLKYSWTDSYALMMELIDGNTAEDISGQKGVWREMKSEQSIYWPVRLFKEIGEQLQCLHDNMLVHRDVKPGNIMMDQNQKWRLVDFDLLTKPYIFAGTSLYTVPLKMLAVSPSLDIQNDVWALATTVYAYMKVTSGLFLSALYEDEWDVLHSKTVARQEEVLDESFFPEAPIFQKRIKTALFLPQTPLRSLLKGL